MKIRVPHQYKAVVTLSSLSFFLAACGGGGGSGASTTSTAETSSLSAAQSVYESVALAANGGTHYLSGNLVISTNTSGVASVNASSYLYSDDVLQSQSASNGTQTVTASDSSVASTLTVPTVTGGRYLVNGVVYIQAVPNQIQISYTNGGVLDSYLASDGKTVLDQLLGTSYTLVPLSGTIASSPSELFSNSELGLITNTVNGSALYNTGAVWQPGSAYMKAVRQMSGDTLQVNDCTSPATTGTSPTPCSTTIATLESFFPYTSSTDGVTYNLADGQIVTLAGVRAWVANTALNTATTTYRVFYQNNGAINMGGLIRNGTAIQLYPLGGGVAQNFNIYLNDAALKSVKAALNF